MAVLAPSILSADFSRLGDEIRAVESGGAGMIHVDVMDGHFVPNITIGPAVTQAVRRVTELPIDVHLMIENPARYVKAFIDAGAEMVSVHVEADPHLHRTLHAIREAGARAGAVINPGTPLAALDAVWDDVDFVLLMSVNPGFGGQRFIPASLERLRELRRRADAGGRNVRIEIDGGVDLGNIEEIAAAGADMIVSGSAIFGTDSPQAAAAEMARRLAAVAERAGRV